MKLHKILVLLLSTTLPGVASASVTFSVNGITTTGGPLAGTFTTNDMVNSVISFNITTPASLSFAAFTYSPSSATVSASSLPSQFFRIDSPGNANELQFYFATGLTTAGGTLLSTNSYENQPSGGNRFLSGTVVAVQPTQPGAVPEPATWAMMIAGMGVIGFAMRRHKVTTRVSYVA